MHVADQTYALPSQRHEGAHYLASPDRCTCPDAQHNSDLCKHSLAVKLFLILSEAEVKPLTPRPLTREAHPELSRILSPRVLKTVRED